MSCMVSVAWSCYVSSSCYTKHGQRCGAVLSGRITTVIMSRSGQLGLHCTVEPNCSNMSAHLVYVSVKYDRALETCEPSCVSGVARHFFILTVHSLLGAVGYVTASDLSSRGGRDQCHETRGSIRAHLDREARSRAEEHVTASELNSVRR
jgi:hypothetical protein